MYLKKRMNAVITACILMTGAFVASCSNDDAAPDTGVVAQGDPVNVAVTINQTSPGTRASTSMIGAEANEIKITDDNLVIFVFDATPGGTGMLESTHAVKIATNSTTGGNTAISSEFTITTGKKFFYIFANANSALEHVKGTYYNGETYLRSLAPANSTHDQFRTQKLEELIIGELSKTENFLIGTLWEGNSVYTDNMHEIPVGTTASAGNPYKIEGLKVGRLVSKISFPSSDFTGQFNTASKLVGDWSNVKWRLVNQPDEMYAIGNWENFLPGNPGSQVKSPFFTSNDLFWDVAADGITQVVKPKSQTSWGTDAVRYTLENTHVYPRKGNTTAVQFTGKFEPTTVHDIAGATAATDDSFWATYVTEPSGVSLKYYSSNPSDYLEGQILGALVIEFTKPVKYKEGNVYYLAYITDSNEPKEQEGNKRYAVLRNHMYKLDIASINGLGDNNDNPFDKGGEDPDNPEPGEPDVDPDPKDPIDKDIPNITISIEVIDWYRIDQSINW